MARARSAHFSSSQIINIIFFLESLYLSARARSVRRARLGAIHRRPQQIGAAPLANSIILFSLSLSLSFCLRLFVCRPDDWPAACLRAPNGQARRPRAAVSRSQSASQSAKQRGGRAFRRRAPRHDRAWILSAAEPEERAQRGPEWGQEWGATRSRGGRKRTNKVAGGRANPIGGRRASRIELESVYLLQH